MYYRRWDIQKIKTGGSYGPVKYPENVYGTNFLEVVC